MTIKTETKWLCWLCGRPITINAGPINSHLMRHVREGIIEKINNRFMPKDNNFWGWVYSIDQEFTVIKTIQKRRALRRFQVGGIVQVGDAVRLEFKHNKENKNRGIWYAHPLGYKADWKLQ